MRDRGRTPPFVLASASPRRRDLLAQIGLAPDLIIRTDVDETPRPGELPRAYALRVAHDKAAAAARLSPPGALVLTADTVVALGRRILPKAEEEACARDCLRLISGRRHRVLTAVVLTGPQGHRDARGHRDERGHGDERGRGTVRVVESVVAFSRLTAAQIDALIEAGDWRGKAGGYAAQGHAAACMRFLSGSYSNVVGLPLFETAQLLRSHGLLA